MNNIISETKISYLDRITEVRRCEDVSLIQFLDDIKSGRWKDEVAQIRKIANRDERKKAKLSMLPGVTISGTFSCKNDKGLIKHSSLICIDHDENDPDPKTTKEKLKTDPYIFFTFVSVSGRDLASIFKIDPNKHRESFNTIKEYLKSKYGIGVDECKAVSHARYVSYDPDIYVNWNSKVLVAKQTKQIKSKRATGTPRLNTDKELEAQVEFVVKQVEKKKIVLGDDSYDNWLRIAFALSDGLGEAGRPYFRRVSSMSDKYDKEECDKQYDDCLKGEKTDDNITIATLFRYAKEARLKIKDQTIITDNPYFINGDGCLYRYKPVKGGVEKQKLANFDAEIKSEVTKDDGVDRTINYIIEGKLKNIDLPQVEVVADKFASMNWMYNWGARAIIEPGPAIKDCVRHYIQYNSNAAMHTCFTHTGWRQIGNEWFYLTGSGAIGAENVSVELSRELRKYNLPLETISKEDEIESIQAGLSFLDIGKKEVTYSLHAITHLAPLVTILNQMPNFSGYLLGGTGLYKTTISGVCLSFFGDFGSISTLPNFSDTANSIERRSFILKDTLMVLDDYHPSAQKAEALKTESTAQRIIRAYSNRTGRGRLNYDSTDKGRYEPRGMLLITGEDLVTLQSTLARVMVVEVSKGDIYKDKLTEIQGKLDSLPYSMASYISWIKDNMDTIKAGFPNRFSSLRADACQEGMHNKLPEQVAYLAFSIETVCSWLIAKDVIDEEKSKRIFDEAWDVFIDQALSQSRRINNENPVQKFIDILQTLITQEKVNLVDKERMTKHYNAEKFEGLGGDHGEIIGYVDNQYCYLLPTAMWRTIQMFCRDEGGHFPIGKNTLYKMLNDQGLIKAGKNGATTTIKTDGKTVRVLALSRSAIF